MIADAETPEYPEQLRMRKVRASQGRMPVNGRWRRLQGKCSRKHTAGDPVRLKRQCKILPPVR